MSAKYASKAAELLATFVDNINVLGVCDDDRPWMDAMLGVVQQYVQLDAQQVAREVAALDAASVGVKSTRIGDDLVIKFDEPAKESPNIYVLSDSMDATEIAAEVSRRLNDA